MKQFYDPKDFFKWDPYHLSKTMPENMQIVHVLCQLSVRGVITSNASAALDPWAKFT